MSAQLFVDTTDLFTEPAEGYVGQDFDYMRVETDITGNMELRHDDENVVVMPGRNGGDPRDVLEIISSQ